MAKKKSKLAKRAAELEAAVAGLFSGARAPVKKKKAKKAKVVKAAKKVVKKAKKAAKKFVKKAKKKTKNK
ncbi:MAG: hypothetical protein NTX21_00875 [Alphaproteobacteria bacterium]|nr:hypothetical protein [Alphaproteobacteria bacterium]